MQCFAVTCVWPLLFGLLSVTAWHLAMVASMNAWIGNLDNVFLAKLGEDSMAGDIPESVFAMFQMTFAIITPRTDCGVPLLSVCALAPCCCLVHSG